MNHVERQIAQVDRGLIFTNLVDFDQQYGHRTPNSPFEPRRD